MKKVTIGYATVTIMRIANPIVILLCFLLCAGSGFGGMSAHGKTLQTRKPLRVIIHKPLAYPDSIYSEAEEAVTGYSTNIDWSSVLNNQFYAGTTRETDNFKALEVRLNYFGDRKYALERMELRGRRLYDGASDNIVNPMYALQTASVGKQGGFSTYGQNWLRMNMKTIGVLAHWTSRRAMSLGIYTAPKHFNNNRVLQKSAEIMEERMYHKTRE